MATRKLAMLDAAASLEFLRSPPGNRLEALKGDRRGQYSIRINDQFRLCFRWTDEGPADVEGDARSWLNLQSAYDLRVAEKANARKIEREISPANRAPDTRHGMRSARDQLRTPQEHSS